VATNFSVAEVNRLILKDFNDRWTYCPILWDTQNVHEDIDSKINETETKLILSPFVEFLSVIPLEIPVSHAMRKVDLVFNFLLAEPEGRGNKSTLEAVDSLNALYSSQMLRLSKDGVNGFIMLDFGEVEYGNSELVQGKYVSIATASCVTFF